MVFILQSFLYLVILWFPIIRMMALKFPDYTLKNNIPKIILLVIAIITAIFLQWIAVPVVFIFYILLSLSTIKIKSE